MTELWKLGALELADKIRSREASGHEVLEAHLARVEEVNGSLDAVVRLLAAEARAAAEASRFTDVRCLTIAAEIESLVGTLTPIDPR